MGEPAHKTLIDRFLDWDLVERRLSRYEHIRATYPLGEMRVCSGVSPYYCHYLAWRLGTWKDERLFGFFDELLAAGTRLRGWSDKRIPKGCEFFRFWCFIWELQVAAFFSRRGFLVEWMESGPDLKVTAGKEQFFAECTTHHKSFAIEAFIDELLHRVSDESLGSGRTRLRVQHTPCIQFSLPQACPAQTEEFLDGLFRPFLDPSFLAGKAQEARRRSPVVLPCPDGVANLYVYMEDDNAQDLNLDQPWKTSGDPEEFMRTALKEALGNKRERNQLRRHRPSLLAVNFLTGGDFQLARLLRPIPIADLGETVDVILVASCGIDTIPSFQDFWPFPCQHSITDALKIGEDYHLTRKPELLRDFDEDAARWRPVLARQYGDDLAASIVQESRDEFASLIPHIPYIGGDENHLTGSLVESVRCLALYRAMKGHGRTAAETGKVLYEAILARVDEPPVLVPLSEVLTPEQLMERRRKRAERSQERRCAADYVYQFVAGDGEEFDYGYDFTECAAQKFYRAQGADEFLPFYCFLDYAQSKVYGLGLDRTMTLAEGHRKCDHRFKSGRRTELGWPPPFLEG